MFHEVKTCLDKFIFYLKYTVVCHMWSLLKQFSIGLNNVALILKHIKKYLTVYNWLNCLNCCRPDLEAFYIDFTA